MRVFNTLSNPADPAARAFKVATKFMAAPAATAQYKPALMPSLPAIPVRRERDTHAVPKPASRAMNSTVKRCQFVGGRPNKPLLIKP